MIKMFCDHCEREIFSADRLTTSVQRNNVVLDVEISYAKDGVWNAGHFCKYCLIDAVANLDDRPKCVNA